MKRKVSKIGPTTLMVSLPARWVRTNNIKKGDELNLVTSSKDITFSLDKTSQKKKEISLDISSFDRKMIVRYIELLYINNYTKIKLHYNTDIEYNHRYKKMESRRKRIKELTHRFIGMEIISQTSNSCEIKCFLNEKDQNLKKIERRIFVLMNDMMDEIISCLDEKEKKILSPMIDQHDNIAKFIAYYLRVLNNSEISDEKKLQLFSFYMAIDRMVDKIVHVADVIEKKGITRKAKKDIVPFFDFLKKLIVSLEKGKIEEDIIKERYKLERKIESSDYTHKEFAVMSTVASILDILKDFMRVILIENFEQS